MTHNGMVTLVFFAIAAGACLWLYWRERQEKRVWMDRCERASAWEVHLRAVVSMAITETREGTDPSVALRRLARRSEIFAVTDDYLNPERTLYKSGEGFL